MKKIIFLFLAAALSLFGVDIKSINFTGLSYISPTVATDISGLVVGRQLTAQDTNSAIVNLYNQGYFENISIENKNGDIFIHLKEKPSIAKVDIQGVVTNDRDAINKIIGVKVGQMYDELAIATAKERIRQFYELRGYLDTVTSVKTEPLNSGSVHIVFKINRGETVKIQKVKLQGATKLDYSDVEPAVANKQKEMLGWMWGFNDGAVKLNELPNDSSRIRDEYMKKGYLDANVSTPYLNAYMDNYSADLTYYIQEGKPYKVGSIGVDIPESVGVNPKDAKREFNLEKGDTVNSAKIRKDIATLENMVADKGYAYAQVIPVTTKNDANHTIDIDYKVEPESKVYIRNLSIAGNDKTADRVIRREMYLTEGNLYSKTDLKDSTDALKRTGYFDDVQIIERRANEHQVDLDVNVTEAPTGSITGGIGYGSGDGILLNAGLSDRNVFGSGMTAGVNIDKSNRNLSGSLSLMNPHVNDGPYSLGGTIFAINDEWHDYKEETYGFNTTLGRQIGRYTNISLTYQLSQTKIQGLNEFYAKAGYMDDKTIKSSLTPGITFNNTDDYYLPRHGIVASTSFEWAGLGGDVEYLKNRTNFKLYQTLEDIIGWDVIFRYKAGLNYIWETGGKEKLPVNDKLFLGGMSTIRGYSGRSIPKDRVCITRGEMIGGKAAKSNGCEYVEIGGLMSFNNSVELSFPLIDRVKMRFITFFDYGTIGTSGFGEEERYSAGAGIEWLTPIGPLQIYYVKPLNKKEYDDTSNIEFMIGRKF